MSAKIKRREFITLLGGAAVAASAQSRDSSQGSGCSSLSEGGFLTGGQKSHPTTPPTRCTRFLGVDRRKQLLHGAG
jgi:hypothetical protein